MELRPIRQVAAAKNVTEYQVRSLTAGKVAAVESPLDPISSGAAAPAGTPIACSTGSMGDPASLISSSRQSQ